MGLEAGTVGVVIFVLSLPLFEQEAKPEDEGRDDK